MKPSRYAIAAALTWDGTRLPMGALPPRARTFLRGKTNEAALPSAKKTAELFSADQVREIRICWVPQLRGGSALNDIFAGPQGKRIAFRTVKTTPFGDILGVVYRR